jgi:hypothetical protein
MMARRSHVAWTFLLLLSPILTTGCIGPIVVPLPGDVTAYHVRDATVRVNPDDGVVVVASGGGDPQGLEATVGSCLRDAQARAPSTFRVVLPDAALRPAFVGLDESTRKARVTDPAFHALVTSRGLRYAIIVSAEQGSMPRTWKSSSGGGGGVLIGTEHTTSYNLTGLALDLSSGEKIGEISAHTDATSSVFWWFPVIFVWVPKWTRHAKACEEFGREAVALLGEDRLPGAVNR